MCGREGLGEAWLYNENCLAGMASQALPDILKLQSIGHILYSRFFIFKITYVQCAQEFAHSFFVNNNSTLPQFEGKWTGAMFKHLGTPALDQLCPT